MSTIDDTRVATLALHAKLLDPPGGYSLGALVGALDGLRRLLYVGAVADARTFNSIPKWEGSPLDAEWELNNTTGEVAVFRASYASPLEVWLQLGPIVGIGGSAITIGRGAIYLFMRFQEARKSKAKADTYVLAQRILQDALAHQEGFADRRAGDVRLAAAVLDSLESLEIVPQGEIEGGKAPTGAS